VHLNPYFVRWLNLPKQGDSDEGKNNIDLTFYNSAGKFSFDVLVMKVTDAFEYKAFSIFKLYLPLSCWSNPSGLECPETFFLERQTAMIQRGFCFAPPPAYIRELFVSKQTPE